MKTSFRNSLVIPYKMRLLIISHTPHYQSKNQILGWGSTIREIDQLARIFKEVVHIAPLHTNPVPGSSLPYTRQNICFIPVEPAGGSGIKAKLTILHKFPGWLKVMKKEIDTADVIHIRCPAAISMFALLAVRLWGKGKPCWVKYAGNWGPHRGKPFSYRLQQGLIAHNFHRGIATINGSWKHQPKHIYSFVNPSFSTQEYDLAAASARSKHIAEPIDLLFVGRLEDEKGAGRILEIAAKLKKSGMAFQLTMVGDGPQKSSYEAYALSKDLCQEVIFAGWQPANHLAGYYTRSHFLLLPSLSEGWPKVLSEAMAYGVVPIASRLPAIAQVLDETGAGTAIPFSDVDAYVEKILEYTHNPEEWHKASCCGVQAAKNFTFERYLQAVEDALKDRWQINFTNE